MKITKRLIVSGLVLLTHQYFCLATQQKHFDVCAQTINQAEVDSRWQSLYDQGVEASAQNKYSIAENHLIDALALLKVKDEAHYVLTLTRLAEVTADANLEIKSQYYYKAVLDYYLSVKPRPDQQTAHNYKLGMAYYHVKDYPHALALVKPSVLQMENNLNLPLITTSIQD